MINRDLARSPNLLDSSGGIKPEESSQLTFNARSTDRGLDREEHGVGKYDRRLAYFFRRIDGCQVIGRIFQLAAREQVDVEFQRDGCVRRNLVTPGVSRIQSSLFITTLFKHQLF